MHLRGRAELDREIAIPAAFKFSVDLKNTGPVMVQLSFSLVCARRGRFLGKVLVDLPVNMGNGVRNKTSLSLIFQLEISIYLLSLLEGKESPHRSRKKEVDKCRREVDHNFISQTYLKYLFIVRLLKVY